LRAASSSVFSPLPLHDALPISEISLAFLTRFTTQDAADWLTPKRLGTWLSKQGYSGKVPPEVLHAHLTGAARGITSDDATTQAQDRKSTRLNSSHVSISYAVFC